MVASATLFAIASTAYLTGSIGLSLMVVANTLAHRLDGAATPAETHAQRA